MSDSKDPKEKSSSSPIGLPDMESTVRLDFGANKNIFSTSDSDEISSSDFEQTLSGLTDIDDMLQSEEAVDHSHDEPTISYATDEINFDELDAGIDALAKEFPEEKKTEEADLDDFADISDITDDDDLFSFDESAGEDATESTTSTHEEALTSDTSSSDFDEWPLIDETLNEKRSEEDSAEPVTHDATESDPSAELVDKDEDEPPVIELTEAMLDESESQAEPDDDQPKGSLDSVAETPGLTTTETNILADATAAIKEIGDGDRKANQGDEMPENEMPEPVGYGSMPAPVPASGGSSAMPTLLALLAMAAGGFGAWMGWDANNRIAGLEAEIRNLQAGKANVADKQSIADMQQRLSKVERRLTGTPTLEAATTLGDTTAEDGAAVATPAPKTPAPADSEQLMQSVKPTSKAITPQTAMATPSGDWVINISSHVNEKAANKEKARLIKLGLSAEVHSATIKNKVWYRVQVIGFATKNEAKAQLRTIEQRTGIKGAWVGKK